jgi:DNA-binding transcriptional MerR regulator
VPDGRDQLQIGEFAELVGLSIPQLRRYDRLQLLAPEGRSESGYRYYGHSQTGAGRVIALLRSMDMPIGDIRRVLSGVEGAERQQLFENHRARLEARLIEVRNLLDAVDLLTRKESSTMQAPTDVSSWLHLMPHLPVSDVER